MPATARPRRTGRVLVAALLAVLAGTAATTAPPDIAPTDAPGDEVAIMPAVVRAPTGRAELDVVLGTDAPADVVVTPRLATPDVAADGTVTAGSAAPTGSVTAGARLRPGERLRIVASDLTAPVLVVVDIGPADAAPADGTAEIADAVAALVLPGEVGPAPSVTLVTVDERLRAVVSSTTPLLVSVATAGAERTTFPDRLVLADQPVELAVTATRWPLPTEVAVTDEAGRTVRESTDATVLLAVTSVLVAAAVLALVTAVRRRVRSG